MGICKAFAIGSSTNTNFSKTQKLSNILWSEGFLPDALDLLDLFLPFDIIISITNSYEKELKNTYPKKLNSNLLVYAGLSIMGKKTKKDFHQFRVQD